MSPKRVSIVLAAGALALAAPPASAQVTYGRWIRTSDCQAAHAPVGVGRSNIVLPQAPGAPSAQECVWQREVLDCPRLRDRVLNFRQCRSGVQKSKHVIQPPRD